MKPYGSTTNRTFWNDWFGKIKNIPFARLRNSEKKKYHPNHRTEVQLPPIKTRSRLKQLWKRTEGYQ